MTDSTNNLSDKLNDVNRSIEDLKKTIKEVTDDTEELTKKNIELREQEIKKLEIVLDIERKQNRESFLHKETVEKIQIDLEKQRKELNDIISLETKRKSLNEEVLELSRNLSDEIGKSLGIVANLNETGFGKMKTLIDKSGGSMNALNNIAIKLSEDLGKRLVVSVFEKGQEALVGWVVMFHELDSVSSNLQKALPNGKQFASMIDSIATSNSDAYLSFQDVGDSIESLGTNFNNYQKEIGTKGAEQITTLTATMQKLGVSTEDTAENFTFAMKAMGMSVDEFSNFELRLNNLSKQTGKSLGKLNQEFKTNQERLSQFSKNKAEKVFRDMSVAASKLGTDMSKLLQITEGFQTFEGAAEAAGSLNSILGGNMINTIDLMNAAWDDPIESFKLIKNAVDKTGKSFKDLTPAMKKTIAEAAHMDVLTMSSLMDQDMSTAINQIKNEADSLKDMQDAAKKATPVLEKLQMILYKFLVLLSPAVEKVSEFVDWLSAGITEGKLAAQAIGGFLVGLGALTVGFMALIRVVTFAKAIGMAFSTVKTTLGIASAANIAPIKAETWAINSSSQAATKAAPPFLSMAVAIVATGAAVLAAAYGMSLFVKAFSGMSPEQIYAVSVAIIALTVGLSIFVAVLFRISKAAAQAGVEMLPLAAAIALIGAGVGLAAYGMAALTKSFTEFMVAADLQKLAGLYLGVNGLAQAFVVLGGSLVALATLGTPSIISFGLAVRISLTDSVLEKLKQTAEYVSQISNGLQKIDTGRITALASAVALTATVGASASNANLSAQTTRANQVVNQQINTQSQMPDQIINIKIDSPVMLNGTKVGDFVQEQIVKRENRLSIGTIHSSVGIAVGGND